MIHRRWVAAAVLGVMLLSVHASAQQAEKGVVTASGQATIKAQPELVRITIELSGQGKDAKEALSKLSEETELARTKLAGLGVTDDAVKLGDPTLGAAGSDARALALAMMQSGKTAGPAAAQTSRVSAIIEARVPLKGTSPQDKLVEAAELMQKAKLAFARQLTPEEQEIVEEMQQRAPGQVQPGEPQFLFVHVISAQERSKATADALAQARESASRLAQAAGAKLGPIQHLSENASSQSPAPGDDYTNYYARALGLPGAPAAEANEAASPSLGPVTFVVSVSVGYALD
jgi:uncharacterized protein YggE